MFGKFMWICGVGLVVGAAVVAVKEIKKEQEEAGEVVNTTEDGEVLGTEKISFKEAAKRKVNKIYRKAIKWAINHTEDIQGVTTCLGLFAAVMGVAFEVKRFAGGSAINAKLNDIIDNQYTINKNIRLTCSVNSENLYRNLAVYHRLKCDDMPESIWNNVDEHFDILSKQIGEKYGTK